MNLEKIEPAGVLVADDDPDILELFRSVLIGATIDEPDWLCLRSTAEAAVEAVRSAKSEDRPLALAYLDLDLPGERNGAWAAQQMRRLDPDLELVIIYARSEANLGPIIEQAPPADKILFLEKPLSPKEIRHFSTALRAKWRADRGLKLAKMELENQVAARTAELRETNLKLEEDINRRREMENVLVKAKQEWERTFDAVPDLIALVGLDYRITRLNRSLADRLGLPPEKVVGLKCHDIFHGRDSRPDVCPHQEMLKTGSPISRQTFLPLLGGEFEIVLVPVEGPDGNIQERVHICRDVTYREQAKRELEESLSLLNATLESTADGLLVVDRQGRVESYNQRLLEMWRASDDLLAAGNVENLFSAVSPQLADPGSFKAKLLDIQSRDEATDYGLVEFTDGRCLEHYSFPRRLGSEVVGRVWSFRDITARRRAEEALRQSEEKYRIVVENANDAICVIQDGLVKFANGKVLELGGVIADDLLGRPFIDWVHPDDRDMIAANHLRRLAGQEAPDQYDFRIVDTHNNTYWMSLSPVRIEWEGRPATLNMMTNITPRKEAEEALRESEEQHRLVLDSSLAGIYVCQEGRLAYVNPRLAEMFGFDRPEELTGRRLVDLIHPDDRSRICVAPGADRPAGPPADHESIRGLTKAGQVIWLEMRASAAVLRGQPAEVGHVLDITRRREAEYEQEQTAAKLENSLALLRATFEASPTGILVVDLEARILDFNRKFCEIFKIAPAVLRRMSRKERRAFITGFMTDQEEQLTRDSELSQRPDDSAFDVVEFRDGRIFERFSSPQRVGARIVGRVWTFHDITERIKTQNALRQSEESYRDLFDNMSDLIYTHDLEGRILSLNHAACATLGYKVEELLGRSFLDFVRDDHQVLFEKEYLPQINKLGRANGVTVVVSKNGRPHFIEFRNSLHRPAQGEPYVRGSGRDVTDRVRAEKEMNNLQQQLLQSQKMEAIGTLAGGVAHDFNNILAGIMGNLDLALSRDDLDEKLRKYLTTAISAADRARDLTRHLLTFSRKTQPEKRPLNLNKTVKEIIRLLRRTTDRKLRLQTLVDPKLHLVMADGVQMNQVLMNLCLNARDAVEEAAARPDWQSSEQGDIEVRADNVFLDQTRVEPGRAPGPYVRLTVSDRGDGMDEETRARIFEPFFTTKPIHKGTGLGLSTVYGIIRQHQGWITVESTPGRGTTFNVFLPSAPPGEVKRRSSRPKTELRGGRETILIVDDEEMIRDFGQEFFGDLGYNVLVASDGQEALDIFRREGDRVDLLLLDMVMPRLSGLEVMDRVRTMDPAVKIILSSGHSPDSVTRERGSSPPPDAFVSKPYHLRRLAETVRLVLDGEPRP